MTQEELKVEYDKYNTSSIFDSLKESVEAQIIVTEVYKGFYYEIIPYSFLRVGMRRGNPIKQFNRLKSTNNLFLYGFNEKKQIIEVREGCEIENQFNHQFLFYEKDMFKSLYYNNGKILQNVSYCYLKKGNLVDKVLGKGRFGGREEYYFYDEDDKLQKIEVKQYDRIGQEAANLFYTIKYGPDGSIDTITKSTSMYEEIVYTEKKA